MLRDSSTAPPPPPSTAGAAAEPPPPPAQALITNNTNSGEDEGDRSFGGNRWPRQETLALLKIRSDMDVAFRDASVKGPLWEEVSRKLAELGFNRNAKKCREKFENVYKYHKRTKDGRTGKQEGKSYRFFDQLEAFNLLSHSSSPPLIGNPPASVITTTPMPATNITVPSTTVGTATVLPTLTIPIPPPSNPIPSSFPSFSTDVLSNSTSSSTSSDVEIQGRRRKRKWKDFFERMMKEVACKQEEMQRKFLEAIEKREKERMTREESWRMQEMAMINREREILAQERSMAAAKDNAVMAFLQKLSDQQNPPPQPQPTKPPPAPPQAAVAPVVTTTNMEIAAKSDDREQNILPASPSRWPKVEVEALIRLRRNMESKYQENGPKGPLWEEISAGMKRLGYNRSSKRCKEKWENINKYFKKVKESNKKRPEDSKTCPYFHQLEALYKEKHRSDEFRPPNSVPLMVMPEQQWPPAPQDSAMDDMESEENQNEDEEDDEAAGEYEIVASKGSMSAE